MPAQRTIKDYLEIFKKNNINLIESLTLTPIAALNAENKQTEIDAYLERIADFHTEQKKSLNDDIQDKSIAEKTSLAALAALLGTLIGGYLFAKEQGAPSGDLFGATTAMQALFAASIGASSSALIYGALDSATESEGHADAKACEEEMRKAGFTNERYVALSAELVKLFNFREALLSTDTSKGKENMRARFKRENYPAPRTTHFHDDDFNLAVEFYFLQQIKALFKQAFEAINQVHDQENREAHHVFQKIKGYFETEANRQEFTQQLQIKFIAECIRFLKSEMNEPGFSGQYPWLMDALAGLMTGSLAVGAFGATTLFIPVFALVCIAIVTASAAAIATHMIITQTESLYYKRSKANRDALGVSIDIITKEHQRLTTLIEGMTSTTNRDLRELQQFDAEGKSSFLTILQGKEPKFILLGSVNAWLRELANRFNQSKMVEIDLSERIEQLVKDSRSQTRSLHATLLTMMTATRPDKSARETLTQFIRDTRIFLQDPATITFRTKFESVQKIKEQVLEIAGSIPAILSSQPLPDILVDFYLAPVSAGGLGGLMSDLEQARRFAPVIITPVADDQPHPWKCFLDTAFILQPAMDSAPNRDVIFQGDTLYRDILKLPANQDEPVEKKISPENIDHYLNASFDFLCTLNQYENNACWKTPFQNRDEFLLYRMLLVKQLATLSHPRNMLVSDKVKKKIKAFVQTKLRYNPDIAFDDIVNQALLINPKKTGKAIRDNYGFLHYPSELSNIANAVRVDMAYVSSALSARQLLDVEANRFLMQNGHKIILGHNSFNELIPNSNPRYLTSISLAIAATTRFIEETKQNTLLAQTHTNEIYLQIVLKETNRILLQIDTLKSSTPHPDLELLDNAQRALEAFRQTLPPAQPVAEEAPQSPRQGVMDELGSFIGQQAAMAEKEKNIPEYFTFFSGAFHKHTRQEKIIAARKLLDALKPENQEKIDLDDEIYSKNPHLRAIIKEYGVREMLVCP